MKFLVLGAFILLSGFSVGKVYSTYQESQTTYLLEVSKDKLKMSVRCLRFNPRTLEGNICSFYNGVKARHTFQKEELVSVSKVRRL